MSTDYFNPPIPLYANLPINAQYFQPSKFVISNIYIHAITTTVITSAPHNYVVGQLVKLLIPSVNGASQLNGKSGYVVSIPSADSIAIDIPSFRVDSFIPNPNYGTTPPQIVAVGDNNTGLISTTGQVNPDTAIPGSFQNISPN